MKCNWKFCLFWWVQSLKHRTDLDKQEWVGHVLNEIRSSQMGEVNIIFENIGYKKSNLSNRWLSPLNIFYTTPLLNYLRSSLQTMHRFLSEHLNRHNGRREFPVFLWNINIHKSLFIHYHTWSEQFLWSFCTVIRA